MAINFVLNGEARSEALVSPTRTVLEYLREDAGLTGTKEPPLDARTHQDVRILRE